jgi:uncharacterized protein YuzE
MAMSPGPNFQINYDDRGDVLYAALDQPQSALSLEIDTDIFLRYVPPRYDVIGITIVDFLLHFPCPPQLDVSEHAKSVIKDLFAKYPMVPMHEVL